MNYELIVRPEAEEELCEAYHCTIGMRRGAKAWVTTSFCVWRKRKNESVRILSHMA